MTYRVRLLRWGNSGYNTAWQRQEESAAQVRAGQPEALAIVEHPPVYTFGRRVRREHLLVAAEELTSRGAQLVESDRGGDITFHGPGQVVFYPILDLKRRGIGPNDYVRSLEETLIRALAGFGLAAEHSPGRPGVWAGNKKIAAIGVRLRGGVTTHGLALNVATDLSWFDAIVPCGISGAGVTSMKQEIEDCPSMATVEDALIVAFEDVFESRCRPDESFSDSHERNTVPSLRLLSGRGVTVGH